MNTRMNRTMWVLLMTAGLAVTGCAATPTAEAVSSGPPTQLEKQYVETIDRLLPGMGAEKIVDREDSQKEFEKICFAASAPDKPAERAALCKAIMTKVGPEVAKPARVWLLRKVEPIGRDEVVAGLVVLFGDKDAEIRELARRALQNNPSPKAAAALRDELAKARTDEWRVALINALGARRDAGSVKMLSGLAVDPNRAVASAAVVALGDIADEAAVETLTRLMKEARPTRDAIVYACIRGAEQLAARGSTAKAVAIYEQLDVPSEAEAVRIAAVEGISRAQGIKAVPRLMKLIDGNDVHMQLIAAQCLRDMPDPKVTVALAKALDSARPPAAAIVLDVLGLRGDPAALRAVASRMTVPDPDVRIAALRALKRIGDSSVVRPIAERAAKAAGGERDAADEALLRLRGKDVDKVILAAMDEAAPPVRTALVRAAAARRIAAALPAYFAAAGDSDEPTRLVVIPALGALASAQDLPKMVDVLVKAGGDATRKAAETAVVAVAQRVNDPVRRAAPVVAALSDASAPVQVSLIHVLGQIQGDAALAALRTSYKSQDKAVKTAAGEALSKWPGQYCVTWLFAGPYKVDGMKATDLFDHPFAPEDASAKAAWKPLNPDAKKPSGEMLLSKVYKDQECCGYVKTNIWSDKEQEVRLVLGSDDGAKVWLNGEVVHAKNVNRALQCGEDKLTVTLKNGWNPLLVKVTQGAADWSFCCGIQAVDGGPVEGLKYDTEGG